MFPLSELAQTEFVFEFTQENYNWSSNDNHNLLFLRATTNYANDKLTATKEPLFLNEVLVMFGFPRTRVGQVVGWAPGSVVRIEIATLGDKTVLRFLVDGVVLGNL